MKLVTPYYTAIVVHFQTFPASWWGVGGGGGVISHMLILATPSSNVHNTKYLNPYL